MANGNNNQPYLSVLVQGTFGAGVKGEKGVGHTVKTALDNVLKTKYLLSLTPTFRTTILDTNSNKFEIQLDLYFDNKVGFLDPSSIMTEALKSGRINNRIKEGLNLEMTPIFQSYLDNAVKESAQNIEPNCKSCEYVGIIQTLNDKLKEYEKEIGMNIVSMELMDVESELFRNKSIFLENKLLRVPKSRSEFIISEVKASVGRYDNLGDDLEFISNDMLSLLKAETSTVRSPNFMSFLKSLYFHHNMVNESDFDNWKKTTLVSKEEDLGPVKKYAEALAQLDSLNSAKSVLQNSGVEALIVQTEEAIFKKEQELVVFEKMANQAISTYKKSKDILSKISQYEEEFVSYLDVVKAVDKRKEENQKLEIFIDVRREEGLVVDAYIPRLMTKSNKDSAYLTDLVNHIIVDNTDLVLKKTSNEDGIIVYQFSRNERARGRKTAFGASYVEAIEKQSSEFLNDDKLNALGFKPVITIGYGLK
ncbi:MAG: hypothetical protein WC758_04210 [Candidatus Woesearchaeota archaeon]|jgi:hypothetical protein